MRIAKLINENNLNIEERKRSLQRRDMNEAYKKTESFVKATKNPVLEVLENLLSGKTEKELHANTKITSSIESTLSTTENQDVTTTEPDQSNNAEFDKSANTLEQQQRLEQPEVKAQIRDLQMAEKEVLAHEQAHKAAGAGVTGGISYSYTTGPDMKQYITGGEVSVGAPSGETPEETIQLLNQVRKAALAPAEPSPQDLRVAATATAQIQQTQTQMAVEEDDLDFEMADEEPFENNRLDVTIPERFMKDLDYSTDGKTIFGQDLESLMFQRTYNKAVSRYTYQMQLAEKGFHMEEPKFSQIA